MKGKTNNPNGRPKGTPNKFTKELRDFIADIVDENREQIAEDLKALEPKDRLSILEKLMQYVLPKKTHTDVQQSQQVISWEEYRRMLGGNF